MLSQQVFETLKPLIARMTLAQRYELIRWIVNEVPTTVEEILHTSDAPANSWEVRITAEAAAWYAYSDADREPYIGKYVAVLNGDVIDSDIDQRSLAIRIHHQYPATPVLIIEAERHKPQEFLILSPRFEKIGVPDV